MKIITHTGNPTDYVLTDTELLTLLNLAKASLEYITDDFQNETSTRLMRKEIDLVNELDKNLAIIG